jgi:hypothetical protein
MRDLKMIKRTIWLLCLSFTLAAGAGTASAVEIQAAPVEQDNLTGAAAQNQSANIGPREPEQKAHGVGMDVFLNKSVAMCSSVLLLPSEPFQQPGQAGVGIRLNPSQLAGIVGFKVLF